MRLFTLSCVIAHHPENALTTDLTQKKTAKTIQGENPDTRIYGRIRMCTYLRRYEATDWHITQLSKHKTGHTFIFW